MNISKMHVKKMVYWNTLKQRIKFTGRNNFEDKENFRLLGLCNEMECEVYGDILFEKFGDNFIPYGHALTTFQNFKKFLDKLKGITNSSI